MRVVLVVSCLLMTLFSTPVRGEEKGAEDKGGKVYAVYIENDDVYVLQDVEKAEFNGIECIKGRHIKMTWAKNRVVYLPSDSIISIVEYDSFDEYKANIEDYEKKQRDF